MKKYIRNLSVFNKTVLFSTLIVVALGVISLAISYQVQKRWQRDTNAARVNYGRFMEESLSKQDVIAAVDSRNGRFLKRRARKAVQKDLRIASVVLAGIYYDDRKIPVAWK
ncbi:hypothetical protein AAAC51_05100 [Priestia megaterium]